MVTRPDPYSSDRSVRAAPLSIAERVQYGRAARERVPLEALAGWDPAVRRRSALDVVLAQNPSRVPSLVPIRMGRMSVSAWTYYRGAAAGVAGDLAASPQTRPGGQPFGGAPGVDLG